MLLQTALLAHASSFNRKQTALLTTSGGAVCSGRRQLEAMVVRQYLRATN